MLAATSTEDTKIVPDQKDLPIGVFDSGVGGISVLREMVHLLPAEDFLFFGDSANAPYGTKTREQIRDLTMQHVRHLYEKGIKAVVIACNTATSAAIKDLRETFTDIPVIGIEPALKPAAEMKEDPLVLVMATPGTVQGEKFHVLTHRFEESARIRAAACPGLVEFVEAGILEGEQIEEKLHALLDPYLSEKPDAIVLGCTHYPFLRRAIRKVVGEGPVILDGSEGTARQLCRQLESKGLRSDRTRAGKVSFEMSVPDKEALCRQLLAIGGQD